MCVQRYVCPSAARLGFWTGFWLAGWDCVYRYVGVASLRMDVGSVWVYFGRTHVHSLYDTYTIYCTYLAYTDYLPTLPPGVYLPTASTTDEYLLKRRKKKTPLD